MMLRSWIWLGMLPDLSTTGHSLTLGTQLRYPDTQHCYIAAHPNLNLPPKFYSLRSRVRDQRVDKTLTNERPARGHALVTPANQSKGEDIRVERNQWFTSAAIKSIYCSNIKYFNLTKAHQATHCNFHWKKRGFKNSNLSG